MVRKRDDSWRAEQQEYVVGDVRVAGYRVEHGASENLEQRVEGRTCGRGGRCDIVVCLTLEIVHICSSQAWG